MSALNSSLLPNTTTPLWSALSGYRVTTDHLARLSSDHPAASHEVCQLLPLKPFPDFPHHLARLSSDHPAASHEVCQLLPLEPFPQSPDHPAHLSSDHPAASHEVCQLSSHLQPEPRRLREPE